MKFHLAMVALLGTASFGLPSRDPGFVHLSEIEARSTRGGIWLSWMACSINQLYNYLYKCDQCKPLDPPIENGGITYSYSVCDDRPDHDYDHVCYSVSSKKKCRTLTAKACSNCSVCTTRTPDDRSGACGGTCMGAPTGFVRELSQCEAVDDPTLPDDP